MKIHKLAKYFPLLEGEEFDALVEDIKQHGQLEPIVTVNDEILDGVNRYNACVFLGIECLTKAYDGDDPLSYVISANIRRRHLDTSQRAMLATEMLPEFEALAEKHKSESAKKQRPSDSTKFESLSSIDENLGQKTRENESSFRVAKQFGISAPTVQRAKRIKEQAPGKVADIIQGKISVGAVDEELRQKAEKTRKKDTTKTKLEITAAQADYINTLEWVIEKLPKNPPQDWDEKNFQYMLKLWDIIISRYQIFKESKNEKYRSISE